MQKGQLTLPGFPMPTPAAKLKPAEVNLLQRIRNLEDRVFLLEFELTVEQAFNKIEGRN